MRVVAAGWGERLRRWVRAVLERVDPASEDRRRGEAFREEVFELYGFTHQAREHIRRTSRIVAHHTEARGGGLWHPGPRLVELPGMQHEAAVHELSHVWWHDLRERDPQLKGGLVRDLVRLSEMDPMAHPEISIAIRFAREYVGGIPERNWPGMFANPQTGERVADVHHLTPRDFERCILDWEIYAGLCSWTMGKFKEGPHQLPELMWRYFKPQFTGKVKVAPYYEGGSR